jgi:hypothetical protein
VRKTRVGSSNAEGQCRSREVHALRAEHGDATGLGERDPDPEQLEVVHVLLHQAEELRVHR